MNKQYDVIIVGAGIVGMAVALGLAQKGLRIALIESQPQKEFSFLERADCYDHRVVAIVRASERLFEQLGVWQVMQNLRVSPYEEMIIWDSECDGQIHFSSSMIFESNLGHIVEQRVILAALWEKIRVQKEITCFFGSSILAIRYNDSYCEVDLKEETTLLAMLLIGADGAKSTVRQKLCIESNFYDYHQTAVVATLKGTLPHRMTAYQRFAKEGPLAWLPLSDPYLTSIVWSTTVAEAHRLCALSVADFNREITRECESRLGVLELVGERFTFPLSTHHAKQYVLPRCALVGDAAHTIHPLAGLGVNLGLADVTVLIKLIEEARRAKRDLGSLRTLKQYERCRRWHNGMIRQSMSLFKMGFGSTLPWVQRFRNKGLNYVNQQPKIKSFFIFKAYFV